MKKLFVGLVVVVAALALAVELVAPLIVEDRIAAHVRQRTAGALGVSADVGTFPVVTRLLATETLPRVGVTLDEVAGQQLTFASVRFALRGVTMDRVALLSGEVQVRDVEGGDVTATVDVDALSDVLGLPVRVEGGSLVVGPAGTEFEVPVEMVDGALAVPGMPGVQLVEDDLLSCATSPVAELGEGRVVVSCGLEGVPFILE